MAVSTWLKTLSKVCLKSFNAVHDELPELLQGTDEVSVDMSDDKQDYLLQKDGEDFATLINELNTTSNKETEAWVRSISKGYGLG